MIFKNWPFLSIAKNCALALSIALIATFLKRYRKLLDHFWTVKFHLDKQNLIFLALKSENPTQKSKTEKLDDFFPENLGFLPEKNVDVF